MMFVMIILLRAMLTTLSFRTLLRLLKILIPVNSPFLLFQRTLPSLNLKCLFLAKAWTSFLSLDSPTNFKLRKTQKTFFVALVSKPVFTTQMLLPIATTFSVLILVNPPGFLQIDNSLLLIFLLNSVAMTSPMSINVLNLVFLISPKKNGQLSVTFAVAMILSLSLLTKVGTSLFGAPTFTNSLSQKKKKKRHSLRRRTTFRNVSFLKLCSQFTTV